MALAEAGEQTEEEEVEMAKDFLRMELLKEISNHLIEKLKRIKLAQLMV